jgi:redox-sensitive bicupin YhaK (pirin superfamily)
MFPLLNTEKSNKLELFQIWLNLPKASKYADPHFEMIWDHELPQWKEEGIFTRLIYGSHGGFKQHKCPPNSWAVNPDNHLVVAQFILDPGATLSFEKAHPGIYRNLYLYDGGELIYGRENLVKNEGLQLAASDRVTLTNPSKKEAYLILMQGKPINEPVAKYGPFVMNESHEIESVIAKYRITEFGGWPWPKAEMTHGSEPIRFATYPDKTTIYAEK